MEKNMTKKDENTIRVSDEVRIINPVFFIRCGYDYSLKDAKAEVTQKYSNQIHLLLQQIKEYNYPMDQNYKTRYIEIEHSLAKGILKHKINNFSERKIYTMEVPTMKDMKFYVIRIRFVKTGTYMPGYDDESPSLSNMKTHKILSLTPYPYIYDGNISYSDNKIEAINVIKIKEKE
jgi:hypothetical protein